MWPKKDRGFMAFDRKVWISEDPKKRIAHFKEFTESLPPEGIKEQAFRCMNCGIPFCHSGCPIGNQIPDFNDAVKDDDWREALRILSSTNNFPEFTGRVCPAPCEHSCVLGITEPPVSIEMLEYEIAERGWREGWIDPQPPERETGKSVAVVGSGPAGMAAAQQLRRAGHKVVVYERDDEPGGLLTYGIPNFKLDKGVVARRIKQMEGEGVEFRCNAEVGKNVPLSELDAYDAVVLAVGSTVPRTFKGMNVPGSDLKGIHVAMDFLPQATRRVMGKGVEDTFEILAEGKDVVVLGGGDTGSDCIGTSLRQKCNSLLNIELMPMPPEERHPDNPWPEYAFVFKLSSSHQEGGEREYALLTKHFEDDGSGHVAALHVVKVEWSEPDETGRRKMNEVPGSERRIPAQLVLLAMGFVAPESEAFEKEWSLETMKTRFGKALKADVQSYMTSRPGVFVAGDARRGQSLVVWAIREGRECARAVDVHLMGYSDLPSLDSAGYDTLPKEVLPG